MRSRQARALLSAERCSQCIAVVCATLQPLGFLRIPHSRLRRVLGSAPSSAAATSSGSVRSSSRRTSSIAWMAIAMTWKRS
jgi:hypothetical protein